MRSAKTYQTARMRRLICVRWSHKSFCRFGCALAQIILFTHNVRNVPNEL